MDFQDILIGIKSGRYTNQRVLPLKAYENSKYTDYNRDSKLFLEEQDRVDSLFFFDCRKAFESYVLRLTNDQWKLVLNYILSGSEGVTREGVISKLAEFSPLAEQFLFMNRKRRVHRSKELSL
jgi:hypothetical protein